MPPRPVKCAPSRGFRVELIPLALGVSLLSAACTTQQVSPPAAGGQMAGMGPLLTVERFLQAANAREYGTMASLFGTVEGPIEGERTEIEVRMDLLARILDHRDYTIASESEVPGRRHPATRVGVDLVIARDTVPDVGFVVVRSDGGRWLVEQIDTEAITGR